MFPKTLLITAALLAPVLARAEVVFDSSLESGNGTDFTLVSENTYSFRLEKDTNSTDSQLFLFAVRGAEGKTLTFRLLDTSSTNVPSHWSTAHPVASADGGQTWERIGGTSLSGDTFIFTHTFIAAEEIIAFHDPYTYTDLQGKLSEWEMSPYAEQTVLGQSIQGRDIHLLRITGDGRPDDEKLGFWFVARQHGAEVTGSYTAEGLIDFLLSDEPEAQDIRANAVVNVIPMVNPDGAVAGNYRDNYQGVNLNRVWDNPSALTSPEVLLARQAMEDWVAAGWSFDFFGDLHSTSGTNPHFAFRPNSTVKPAGYHDPENFAEDAGRFLDMLAARNVNFDPTHRTTSLGNMGVAGSYVVLTYGVVGFTFEGAYNDINHGPNRNEYMTPTIHRGVGQDLARTLDEYFELEIVEQSVNWSLH